MWGTNMNILKDPPKAVFTRRIDKVGQTQEVLNSQGEGTDRINEFISVYARGVNPMVSVSYQNSGGGQQASLPYKVENVRPPILRQEDTLPLSRMPRDWFYTFTNPQFPQFIQHNQCQKPDVRDRILSYSVPSRPYYEKTPILDSSTRQNVHSNVLRGIVPTNKSGQTFENTNNIAVTSSHLQDPIHYNLDTNKTYPLEQNNLSEFKNRLRQIVHNKKVFQTLTNKHSSVETPVPILNTRSLRSDILRLSAHTNKTVLLNDTDLPRVSTQKNVRDSVLHPQGSSNPFLPIHSKPTEPVLPVLKNNVPVHDAYTNKQLPRNTDLSHPDPTSSIRPETIRCDAQTIRTYMKNTLLPETLQDLKRNLPIVHDVSVSSKKQNDVVAVYGNSSTNARLPLKIPKGSFDQIGSAIPNMERVEFTKIRPRNDLQKNTHITR
jgi:hypothetical protein